MKRIEFKEREDTKKILTYNIWGEMSAEEEHRRTSEPTIKYQPSLL